MPWCHFTEYRLAVHMLRNCLGLALKTQRLLAGNSGAKLVQGRKTWREHSGRRFKNQSSRSWNVGGPGYEIPGT